MNVPEREIIKKRRLYFNAEVLCHEGDRVDPETVVAKAVLPLPRQFFMSAYRVLPGSAVEDYEVKWHVQPGDEVGYDEPLVTFVPKITAKQDARRTEYRSTFPGTIEEVIKDTGNILLREYVNHKERKITVPVGPMIGVRGKKLKKHLKIREGDFLEKGQVIAYRREAGFEENAFLVERVKAPIAGEVKLLDLDEGIVKIERNFNEVKIMAGFFGRVTSLKPEEIEITGKGRRLEALWGIGKEGFGRLSVLSGSNQAALESDRITEDHNGRVLLAGSFVTFEALERARDVGVRAIITGGVDHQDISNFAGGDVEVSFTGREKVPFPVVTTGGFGEIPMEREFYEFMAGFEDSYVHVNGTTHMRAGVLRPEIIISSRF